MSLECDCAFWTGNIDQVRTQPTRISKEIPKKRESKEREE
jgi:hypothetical protein